MLKELLKVRKKEKDKKIISLILVFFSSMIFTMILLGKSNFIITLTLTVIVFLTLPYIIDNMNKRYKQESQEILDLERKIFHSLEQSYFIEDNETYVFNDDRFICEESGELLVTFKARGKGYTITALTPTAKKHFDQLVKVGAFEESMKHFPVSLDFKKIG